jgi:wobble nucleotide-excising tRNase
MLNKIVTIKNVGKFRSCSAAGDVTFRKLTLIYAENGRGKTTFCDIIRSLQCADDKFIRGRTSFGSVDKPLVEVLVDNGKVAYKDHVWTASAPDIAIYDAHFLHENVYTGDFVTHDHRRNLHKVIIGEQGVALALRVDEFDERIRTANREISRAESNVQSQVPRGVTLAEFLKLERVDKIEDQIELREREVAALKNSADIATRPAPQKLPFPTFPQDFEGLLSRNVEGLIEDAERIVQKHLQERMLRENEAWLVQGLQLVKDNEMSFLRPVNCGKYASCRLQEPLRKRVQTTKR